MMAVYHDEIEIEDFDYDEEEEVYYYPCPCGDKFQITKDELRAGEDTATCPSCSLIIRVIYNKEDFQKEIESEKDEEELARSIKKLEVN